MSPLVWYLLGIATLPVGVILWFAFCFVVGWGEFTFSREVNGEVQEWRR